MTGAPGWDRPTLAHVSRWTQTWLSGPQPSDGAEQEFPGQRLGLPAAGPGSAATFLARVGGLVVDWLPCLAVARLLSDDPSTSTLLLFATLTVLTVGLTGRSPGHAVLGLRVATLSGGRPAFGAAAVRTVLLCLVVPPLITDADGRGLHDRAIGTIVLRTR